MGVINDWVNNHPEDIRWHHVSDKPMGNYNVVVNVERVENFVLSTKDKDYVLDFQKLLEDYGIEVKE